MDGAGACSCTSSLYRAVLQYLLHPDGHVGHILGDSLDSLHQAGWLKPVHTTTWKHEWSAAKAESGPQTRPRLAFQFVPVQKYTSCLPTHRSKIIRYFILKSFSAPLADAHGDLSFSSCCWKLQSPITQFIFRAWSCTVLWIKIH